MEKPRWHDLGLLSEFAKRPLTGVPVDGKRLVVTHKDGAFGVLSAVCSHSGGPLDRGKLEGDYVVCPWHAWTFQRQDGHCKVPWDHETTPAYTIKTEEGHLWVDLASATKRVFDSQKHPLAREPKREPGKVRVVGISTTAMNLQNPRVSTSDTLLEEALRHAEGQGAETRMLKLNQLKVRPCEGYYSISARACTWPCTITQQDKSDEMKEVYEALVHWADVVIVSTPIRWGAASSLYFKMAERLNCVQNQVTTGNKVLIRNKVAAFIVTGGQDNVQAVAGQMTTFFGELGFQFPQFHFIGHSRGWSAEDMERNVAYVQNSDELKHGARSLVERAMELSHTLLEHKHPDARTERSGRKGSGVVEKSPVAP